MCQYNQAHPTDCVHFFGFDAQPPQADLAELAALSFRSWQDESLYMVSDLDHPEVTEADGSSYVLQGARTFGTALAARVGDAYAAIALTGYDVGINWPGVGKGSLGASSAETLEARLHAINTGSLIVDFRTAALGTASPQISNLESAGSPLLMTPSRQYRGAIYLSSSPPMKAVFW